jgi:hypothetical protein
MEKEYVEEKFNKKDDYLVENPFENKSHSNLEEEFVINNIKIE